MSRTYKLAIEAVGITKEQLGKIAIEQFGWEGETDSYKGRVYFDGEGRLYGGMDEEDAHIQIYKAIKAINSEALAETTWTNLEELPCESYGDVIE